MTKSVTKTGGMRSSSRSSKWGWRTTFPSRPKRKTGADDVTACVGGAGPTPTLSQPEIGLGNSTAQFHPDLHEDRGGQDRLKARGRAPATAGGRGDPLTEFGRS